MFSGGTFAFVDHPLTSSSYFAPESSKGDRALNKFLVAFRARPGRPAFVSAEELSRVGLGLESFSDIHASSRKGGAGKVSGMAS
jgi:hypothetical protein